MKFYVLYFKYKHIGYKEINKYLDKHLYNKNRIHAFRNPNVSWVKIK